MTREILKIMVASFLGAALATGFFALADSDPTTDNVAKLIPYRGHLMKDGQPFTGTIKMRFKLYDGITADTPVWSEEQNVNVYNGTFTVLLGSAAGNNGDDTLWQVIKNADDLYLEIAIVEGEEGNEQEILLANRQRFLPVPYSLWTTASTEFEVRTIKGINDSLTLDTHYLTITGTDIIFAPYGDRGEGGRAMVHDEGDVLTLNWGNDFDGGIKLTGYTNITGDARVGGSLEVVGGKITLGSITDALSTSQSAENSSHYNLVLKPQGSTGHVVIEDTDLILGTDPDFTERGDGGRALVHYDNDSLVINYDNDFEGGVTLGKDAEFKIKSFSQCDCEWVDIPKDGDQMASCPDGKFVHAVDNAEGACQGDGDACLDKVECCRPCLFKSSMSW